MRAHLAGLSHFSFAICRRIPEGTVLHSNQNHSFRRSPPPGTKSKVSKASVHTRLMSADCSPLPHNQHDQCVHSGLEVALLCVMAYARLLFRQGKEEEKGNDKMGERHHRCMFGMMATATRLE